MSAARRADGIYAFKDAAPPIDDFFNEVERGRTDNGVSFQGSESNEVRVKRPQSIVELGAFVGRAPPDVTRTLGKLEAIGFLRMKSVNRRKAPVTSIRPLRITVDPFSYNDQLELA
jgi:hypothetical protein